MNADSGALRSAIAELEGRSFHLALAFLRSGTVPQGLSEAAGGIRTAMAQLKPQAELNESDRSAWERALSEVDLNLAFAAGDTLVASVRLSRAMSRQPP